MRRYYGKRDNNHLEIKHALEGDGWRCCDTHMVGDGFPDMVVGKSNVTVLLEVKNRDGFNKIDKKQIAFSDEWTGGNYIIVYEPNEDIEILGALL